MSFQRINANEAKTLIEQGANLADVRDALSYQSGHIRGAVRIDNSNLQNFMDQADKHKTLVIYCYHGNSSQGVAQFFTAQGYEQVYSLNGGYEQWQALYPEFCV